MDRHQHNDDRATTVPTGTPSGPHGVPSDRALAAALGIPTATPIGAPPAGPLGQFPTFAAQIHSRLLAGAAEYGDRSFVRDPGDLLGEIEEELLDVVGWAYILWCRVHALRARVDPRTADPEGDL